MTVSNLIKTISDNYQKIFVSVFDAAGNITVSYKFEAHTNINLPEDIGQKTVFDILLMCNGLHINIWEK